MRSPFCMKVCNECGKLLVANNINFAKDKKSKYGLRGYCKICGRKKSAEFRKSNPTYQTEYRKNNPDKIKKYKAKNNSTYQAEYRKNHPTYYTEYRKNNPDKYFNYHQKRRQFEELGPGISKEEWVDMMNFFNWKCAYSGESLTKDNRSIDHVTPLKNYGWNGIINCVPCTKNINSSKKASDMVDWYKKQDFYSDERLSKIYEWIEYSINKYTEHITI